ncbi:PREDICTED: TMV resistance N [Prunus dulcis]|uniref:PREDICTED: TMV resistance N n=1 Tax=Prunus dulcis TaxID=3755 RepID=A0A5E4FAZ1_PRUDU|nr:PREDICTED: TMV resistance N [Prunus dulcis]
MKNQFYPGRKIVITTRRSRLLKDHRVTKVLDVETLDYDESLELFGWYAFGQDYPIEGYLEYSEKAMYHCGGLALALKVLRCSLLGESIGVWKSAFEKLEAIPNVEIMNKLRISYDSLEDDYDRKLFLHIACFFIQTFSHFLVISYRIKMAVLGLNFLWILYVLIFLWSLIVLEMQYSSLRQVCKGAEVLPSLKILDLSHSHGLINTDDFSFCPNIEKLILADCTGLIDLHES